MTTNILNADIIGEGLRQCQSSSDVVVSASRQTAASCIAAATRALKRENAASYLHDEGDDDYGHEAGNVPFESATPSAAKAYILSPRSGSDDTSGVDAPCRDTNERVQKSDVGRLCRHFPKVVNDIADHFMLDEEQRLTY